MVKYSPRFARPSTALLGRPKAQIPSGTLWNGGKPTEWWWLPQQGTLHTRTCPGYPDTCRRRWARTCKWPGPQPLLRQPFPPITLPLHRHHTQAVPTHHPMPPITHQATPPTHHTGWHLCHAREWRHNTHTTDTRGGGGGANDALATWRNERGNGQAEGVTCSCRGSDPASGHPRAQKPVLATASRKWRSAN